MTKLFAAFLSFATFVSARAAADAEQSFHKEVEPLLKTYCIACHGPKKQKAKVNLTAHSMAELAAKPEMWLRALERLESGEMPPKDEDQPSARERARITAWLRGAYTDALLVKQRVEGRSKLRRLTRTEYANTMEDLFGVRPTVESILPPDGNVDGYDKVSGALPLSAEGAMAYFRMAGSVNRWVLGPLPKPDASGDPLAGRTTRAKAMESGESPGHSLVLDDGWIVSFNTDTSSGRLDYHGAKFPAVHKVRLSVQAYQTDQPLAFGIYVGRTHAFPQQIELAQVLEAPPGKPTVLEVELRLKPGDGMRLIPFGLGVPVPKNSQAGTWRAPGLAVQWAEFVEPELPFAADALVTADLPRAFVEEMRRMDRVLISTNKSAPYVSKSITRDEFLRAMTATFTRIAPRILRSNLKDGEVASWVANIAQQVDDGAAAEGVFLNQLSELLITPDFLCLVEEPGPLNDFALAVRLSYFLWVSAPDETLLELARAGRLHDPRVLREQTTRLLDDPKAARFVNDFADQWLSLRAIADTSPDGKLYPDYNELVRFSSVLETQGYLRRMLAENLGVTFLVASPWTLLNEPLARHYGLPPVAGIGLRNVNLPAGSPYGGLWTHSAVMKVTANGNTTTPVKRGVWVAERLLGLRIPPPPPDIMPIEPDIRGAKTLREQLALHRDAPSCAACHAKFDPYGFALESFDVAGVFRARYRIPGDGKPAKWADGLPVDASGTTPDGKVFSDIRDLRRHLEKNPAALARGLAGHLVTYATGAAPTPLDEPAIAALVNSTARDGHGFRSLIHAVVQSELFRNK